MKPKPKHNHIYAQFRGIETEMITVSPNCLQEVFHLVIHVCMLEDYLLYIRMVYYFLKATFLSFDAIQRKMSRKGM